MEIASDRVAVVIGSRGLVLSEIKSRSRCKIVITQDVSASSTSKVLFTGMQDDIDFAMELVQRVVNEGPKALTSAQECIVETISISSSFVGKVLGVQGSTIKEIQKRCLVRMKIEEDAQGSDQRALVINGEPANVKSAVDLTYQVLEMGAEFAFANSQPSPPQHLPLMLPHHMTHAPINSLPLGADGTAGALFPAEPLTEAMFAQVSCRTVPM
jgi:polyribonucleotide nucleotidyltransferase